MNFIIWLIVGAIVGWLASMIMRTDGQQGLLLNIIVGVVGAFVAGVVLTPLLGIATINQNNFSLPGVLVSIMGSVILLAVVSLFRSGARR
ncbi:MAG: GlsB/YeaQ/YmgE family stress response membrane protein [Chloroflexi bacterium]|nr:GlsB/YeaQ/YmgE family stress response membrane protein [Chloroflexota bacterium]MDA0244470.1 GlsB/YeaQ/YmgE family stress response membrane protein [Chloroflexota bacterium]